jgi:hypothetical protein
MKSRRLMCITAMTLFAGLALPIQLAAQHTRHKLIDLGTFGGPSIAREPTFTTFDAPGAATGSGFGTLASGINPEGVITGFYTPVSGGNRSFLRARDGTITTFNAPGALSQVTFNSINPAGTITGLYVDTSFVFHGFLRAPDGTFTTYDLPAGSTVTTITPSIDPEGAITGYYLDASSLPHGFLRAPDGTFTTFDAPGANGGTFPGSINPEGAITGYYVIVTIEPSFSLVFHGFLRAPDDTIRTFDAPGALATFASSINPEGAIAGNYYDASNVSHGYLRTPHGTFTTFDAPGAGTGAFQGTGLFGIAINTAGAIAGTYIDASNGAHGFLRARDGMITTFDAPDAGTGPFLGTFVTSINTEGAITGYYLDASGTIHGFLRSP